ncbi:MAG: hypothetical protein AB1512_16980 [Thermodesulfobacteriota bacterium]
MGQTRLHESRSRRGLRKAWHLLFVLLALLLTVSLSPSCLPALPQKGIHVDKVVLPPGFKIQIYRDGVPNARSMAISPKGTLYVGTKEAGRGLACGAKPTRLRLLHASSVRDGR